MSPENEVCGGTPRQRPSLRSAKPAARLVAAVLLALSGLWPAPGPARAHAYIESSSPPDGARLQAAPDRVRITYTEPVETRVTKLTLIDAEGRTVPGTEQVSEGDMVLILKLPPLPPGRYTVKSNTLGKDGHPTEESIQFAVGRVTGPEAGPDAAQAPARDPAAEEYRAIKRVRAFGLGVLAAAMAIAAVPALRALRRRRGGGAG